MLMLDPRLISLSPLDIRLDPPDLSAPAVFDAFQRELAVPVLLLEPLSLSS
jgi:hypothetical protein